MPMTKAPKKSTAHKQVVKLQGQIKLLKEKRKVLTERITAMQNDLNQAKEGLKVEKTKARGDESE